MKKPSGTEKKTDVEHPTVVARIRLERKTLEDLAGDAKLAELEELSKGWIGDQHAQDAADNKGNAKKKQP